VINDNMTGPVNGRCREAGFVQAIVQTDPPPPPGLVQIVAALAIGSVGLMMTGMAPILLGGLHRSGQLATAEIGVCAMAELLIMGLTCGIAGWRLPARHMRLIAIVSGLATAGLDLISPHFSHLPVILVRGLAGLPEGLLLWIAIAVIARQGRPERMAALFLTSQVAGQFTLILLFSQWIGPRFGLQGLFAGMAVTGVLAVLLAMVSVDHMGEVPQEAPTAQGAAPRVVRPHRGWISLIAMMAYVAAGSGVYVYLEPIAARLGLPATTGALAVQFNLVGQVLGGLTVTWLSGRVRYGQVFLFAGVVCLASYGVYLSVANPWVFALCAGVTGYAGMLVTPFFVPMSLDADPTRRTATMAGGAQLLGAAMGPLAAAGATGHIEGVLGLSALWVVISVSVASWLSATHRPVV
jgi:hypothetical protein